MPIKWSNPFGLRPRPIFIFGVCMCKLSVEFAFHLIVQPDLIRTRHLRLLLQVLLVEFMGMGMTIASLPQLKTDFFGSRSKAALVCMVLAHAAMCVVLNRSRAVCRFADFSTVPAHLSRFSWRLPSVYCLINMGMTESSLSSFTHRSICSLLTIVIPTSDVICPVGSPS